MNLGAQPLGRLRRPRCPFRHEEPSLRLEDGQVLLRQPITGEALRQFTPVNTSWGKSSMHYWSDPLKTQLSAGPASIEPVMYSSFSPVGVDFSP